MLILKKEIQMTEQQTKNNSQNQTSDPGKRKYTTLWVMIFLFILPYIAAFYFYFNKDSLDLGEGSNYGNIVSPAKPLSNIQLTRIDGSDVSFSSLKGKWTLLTIGKSSCLKDCVDNLYKIRQIKKAVGQEHKRIQKAFFLIDESSIDSFKSLLGEYPGMSVFIPSNKQYESFLLEFSISGESIEDNIFVVDPLGNYMMMYPKGSDPSKMLKDIERLLKVSKIG